MADTAFDIYDINSAFAVDEPALQVTHSSVPDLFAVDPPVVSFAVDEASTNRASSSPEAVMPQFLSAPLLRTDGRQSVNPWDPRLVGDLALGVDSTEEVIDRYGLSKDEFERLCEVPAFRRELSVAVRDLRENGTAYSEKCKAMSSTYLERIDQLIYDNATPASTVLAAAQWVAKMAKLEPREEKADAGTNATQVNISICYT